MNAAPLISVVVPTYNSAHYVTEAIESVLQQTVGDWELLVVDDGSTDNTRDTVAAYAAHATVRYLYQKNSGVSVARNHGIEESRGRYVAFLDADDAWLPQKLDRQMAAIQATDGAGLCYTAHLIVDDRMQTVAVRRSQQCNNPLADLLLRGNLVGSPSSVLVERQLLQQMGGFDTKLSHSADWDAWLRLAPLTRFVYVDEPLIRYRQHDTNMSRNTKLLESDTIQALQRALTNPDAPPGVRAQASRVLARQWMVIAGCYFQDRQGRDFARCALRSIKLEPRQAGYLLNFPLRMLQRKLVKKRA